MPSLGGRPDDRGRGLAAQWKIEGRAHPDPGPGQSLHGPGQPDRADDGRVEIVLHAFGEQPLDVGLGGIRPDIGVLDTAGDIGDRHEHPPRRAPGNEAVSFSRSS